MTKYILFISLSILSVQFYAQHWEPMDVGIECVGTNWPVVYDIEINTQTNELFISGSFYKDGYGNDLISLAKWDDVTNSWEPPEDSINVRGLSMFNFSDKFYISGRLDNNLTGAEGSGMLSCIDNGSWSEIQGAPTGGGVFNSIVVDEKVYLVGNFDQVSNSSTSCIAIFDGEEFEAINVPHLNSNSTLLNDVVKWRNGIYVSGKALSHSNGNYEGVARVENNIFHPVHIEFTGEGSSQMAFVTALEVFQDNLYIAGEFYDLNGFTGRGIQYFDGEEMHSLGGMGVDYRVWDLEVYEGELYIVGEFKRIVDLPGGELNQSIPAKGIAKWDGESWISLNDEDLYSLSGTGMGIVSSILFHQDTMYVAGNFCSRGGNTSFNSIMRSPIPKRELTDVLEGYSIYPNPAQENFTLLFKNPLGHEAEVLLFNQHGQLVYETKIPKWGKKVEIKTSQFAKGVYTVTAKMREQQLSKKVLVF